MLGQTTNHFYLTTYQPTLLGLFSSATTIHCQNTSLTSLLNLDELRVSRHGFFEDLDRTDVFGNHYGRPHVSILVTTTFKNALQSTRGGLENSSSIIITFVLWLVISLNDFDN